MRKLIGLFLIFALAGEVHAQFKKGINLTGWFQVSGPRQIQFSKFTFKDFQQIKSLGCDVVRLPINLHAMTSGSPDYKVDPLFLGFLDSVVLWCETLHVHLIIDNHTFDPSASTPVTIGEPLTRIWYQLSSHYKNRSTYLYYEILNEPHGIAEDVWGKIQQRVIDTIRKIDSRHTIIAGAANWNSYQSLKNLPFYKDTNLIYTFHFYDPFIFTHQGASWAGLTDLHGVPYPYDASRMPACPPAYQGTWIESELTTYYKNSGTDSAVRKLIDIAIEFRESRHVKIYCGEFGVYNAFAADSDRVYWYHTVREYLEQNNIPWTIWDYKGAFGIFEKGSNELFEHDLHIPLLQALGLNIPEQSPLIITPDTTGFLIYHDYITSGINESSWAGHAGTIDYYNNKKPATGHYCIEWNVGEQYTNLGFDFVPNKDLSFLKDADYALCFLVRGYGNPGFSFDVRFVDSKVSDADHPWRLGYTITSSMVSWDGYWHKLYLPLNQFREYGSWDNGWYNPEGKFDWHDIDRLEVVSEHSDGDGITLWLDEIYITRTDTLIIRDTSQYIPGQTKTIPYRTTAFEVFPNPASNKLYVKTRETTGGICHMMIYDPAGHMILTDRWNTEENNVREIPLRQKINPGFYILMIEHEKEKISYPIIVQ